MPELCQMWESREGGDAFPAASPNRGGTPVPRCAARAGMAGVAPLGSVGPGQARGDPGHPGWVWGGWVGASGDPPALAPLQSRIVPGSAGGGGGAGPRASGKAGGKAGAGTCWSRLSCWWSCSSRLPVCPCSSPAARAGCIPRGRSRPALPWRGSWVPPAFPSPPSSYTWDGQRAELGLSLSPAAGGLAPRNCQLPGGTIPLLTSLSFSPHPCLAPRVPVQPGDASAVTTCWDVRHGWEALVPSLSHLVPPSSDPCHALLPGTS